jgi:ERCC4-related helicase
MAHFKPGDTVRAKGKREQIGRIISQVAVQGGEEWYLVEYSSGHSKRYPASCIELYKGTKEPEALFQEACFGGKENLSRLLTLVKFKNPLQNHLYSLQASRTLFLPYQFKPLFKFLHYSERRLLIADEVGLGKTIETGIVLAELRARESLKRVLVVCPSALTIKWRDEMRRRFDEEFQIWNSRDVLKMLGDASEKGDALSFRAICSLQMLRAKPIQEKLKEQAQVSGLKFDLMIIDEAHHLRNVGTLSNLLGRELNDMTESTILLTATPIHLGNENLFNLLRILSPTEFTSQEGFGQLLEANRGIVRSQQILERPLPDFKACKKELVGVENTVFSKRFIADPVYKQTLQRLDEYDARSKEHIAEIQENIESLNLLSHIFTRTKKRDVIKNRTLRSAETLPVQFTEAEMAFYNGITGLIKALHVDDAFGQFVVIMPQRQMASSIPAMIEHYAGRINLSEDESLDETSEIMDWSEDEFWDDPPARKERPQTITEMSEFRRIILEARKNITRDSKLEALLECLRHIHSIEPSRKVLVFSYFRKTLEYLSRELKKRGYENIILHGGVESNFNDPLKDERGRRIRQFETDVNVKIMLSSEVGSEGLDFQFANTIVNYDLPWNPMKVEQRIGRLDRLGQKSEKIFIFNFAVKGTVEERILDRLYQRINIFRESIGDLEAILGEQIPKLTLELLLSELSPEEQERRIDQTLLVIERNRRDQERLEQKSSELIGHESFLDSELAKIREHKRFLTPAEMRTFLGEFLKENFPRSTLKQVSADVEIFELSVCDKLEQFVRSKIKVDDPLMMQFLRRSIYGKIKVTFDSRAAYEDRDLEYLHFFHPLMRAAKNFYEEYPIHPISKIELRDQNIEPGEYFFFIYFMEVDGIKCWDRVEYVLVERKTLRVIDGEPAEGIVISASENGESYGGDPGLDRDELKGSLNTAFNTFIERRYAHLKDDWEIKNQSLFLQRKESHIQSFDRKIKRLETELIDGEQKGWSEKRLQMTRGALRNRKAELEQKLLDLTNQSRLISSVDLISAGYLNIRS